MYIVLANSVKCVIFFSKLRTNFHVAAILVREFTTQLAHSFGKEKKKKRGESEKKRMVF